MKRLISLFLSIVIILTSLLCVDLSAFALNNATIDYRLNNDVFESVLDKYTKLKKISKSNFAIPGLESTNILNESCDCMTPQGICVAGDYILITAYCNIKAYKDDLKSNSSNGSNAEKLEKEENHSKHCSVIYVVSKSSKKYLTTLVLPDKNHVGGIAYDGNYIWVAKSTDEQLGAILLSDVTNAVSTGEDSVSINYYANVYCDCIASFVITYQSKLWVGVCNSDGTGIGILRGFTVSGDTADTLELTAVKELTIPAKANGAAFATIDGETCLAVNSSYGRNNDTTTYLYTVDLESDSDISVYTNYDTYTLPPMAEEICIDGSDVYTLFESGSTPYSCVDGNRCNNIVDRVCISQLDDWFYWTANNYQDEEEAVTPPEVTTPGMAYEPTSAADAKYLNTYVYADGAVKTMYNPYTASMALDMSNTAYKISTDDTWSTSMSKYGYSQIKRVENNGVYTLGSKVTEDGTVQNLGTSVNATVGLKKVIYNGQTKYCVAIAFRGTDMTDFADVITDINLIPNGNGIHSGFADVANDFTRDCDNIKFKIDGKTITLAEMILDMKTEGSQYQLLVTGHSLGGAVADVFVAQNLVKTNGVNPSNVVAYTFAAARSVSSSYSYNHNNIINIINADDIVPTIGGAKQIGNNITFTPDDTFREANYGSNYVEGHTSAWWINAVDSAKTGFVAHKLNPVYNSIIKNIKSNIIEYAVYNVSCMNNKETTIKINKNCFSYFEGDWYFGGLIFEDACMEVLGDLNLGKDRVGPYQGGSRLIMTSEDDYLKVHKNINIYGTKHPAYPTETELTGGTIEIYGDFIYDGYYFSDGFVTGGNQKIIFAGVESQKCGLYHNEVIELNIVVIKNNSNEGVRFLTKIPIKKLFHHNGCNFSSINPSSYFPDYDGDGLRDNVDPDPVYNPVESISFIPAENKRYYENTNGCKKNVASEDEYYEYMKFDFAEGDILTVNYKDGKIVNYECQYNRDNTKFVFFSDNGDVINVNKEDGIRIYDDQNINHWLIGDNNYYWVEYAGSKFYIPVLISEKPLAEYKGNINLVESSSVEQWFEMGTGETLYYQFDLCNSNSLNISLIDYKNIVLEANIYLVKKDVFDANSNVGYNQELVNLAYKTIDFETVLNNSVELQKDADENWSDYYIVFDLPNDSGPYSYKVEFKLNFEVFDNCSHDYIITVHEPTCIEHGYTEYTCAICGESYWSDYTEATYIHTYINGFCKYCNAKDDDYILPTISLWETKMVNIENGGDSYYFSFTPETDGDYLFSSNSKIDTFASVYDSDMNLICSQMGSGFSLKYHFEANKTYILGCKYFSSENTGEFYVSLTEKIRNISFTPSKEYVFTENTNGEKVYLDENDWFWEYNIPKFNVGDVLTVSYNDGKVVDYVYYDENDCFISIDDSYIYASKFSNQYNNNWKVGKNNYFFVVYNGFETQVPITIIEKTEHIHFYTTQITEPTCTEKGYTTYTCSCGDSYIDDEIAALGHSYGQWIYNGDAEYVSSTNYKNGTQTRTCSVCGAEETVEAPNTALLRRRGNALALESSITLTTYITKDVVDYYDEVYAEFTRNGKSETVYASDKTFKSGSTVYNIFDYAGISPQAMGDDIEIKFYGIKDGVKYWGEAYTYSVTTYVTSTLSKSTTSDKLKRMLVDLMYYGEACQIYQNYKTDSLMTNILTDDQKKYRSTDELNLKNIKDSSYTTCENRLVKFGTALRLNNAVEIAIPLNMTNVTLEELTFRVKIGSRDLTYTYSDNPENFEKGKDGYWYFYFDGVYANQMSDEVFITAYRDNEQISYTLKYSVESYAATVTDSKLKKVTDAMMRYGNSAKVYSGK